MAGLMYFLPGASIAKLRSGEDLVHNELNSPELAGVLADVRGSGETSFFECNSSKAPGGKGGVLIVPFEAGEPGKQVGYFPESQVWQQTALGSFWIGHSRNEPVRADHLRRRTPLVNGYDVELAGQVWHVPMVRRPPNVTALPREMEFDGAGNLVFRLSPTHQRLWDELGRFVETLYGDRPHSDDDERDWATLAIDVLAVNYRVGRSTQNVLHLVNSDTYQQVLNMAVDVPFYEAQMQKKSE